MGTVDIEQTVEEILLSDSDNIWWPESLPYEQIKEIVREAVEEITENHYKRYDGEIEDWDVWESDVVNAINRKFENMT